MSDPDPLLLDIPATAKLAGVSRRTLDSMLCARLFGPEPVKINRRFMFRRQEVVDWVNAGAPCKNKWNWNGGTA
jgi:predicted DNA-binding transcriptional regulator AlpA